MTTPDGVNYTLDSSGYGWKWTSAGSVPKMIGGVYLSIQDAKNAFISLCSTRNNDKLRLKYEPTLLEELDVLTRKQELLDFAEKNGIHVPAGLSRPTQIKKMLKEAL